MVYAIWEYFVGFFIFVDNELRNGSFRNCHPDQKTILNNLFCNSLSTKT